MPLSAIDNVLVVYNKLQRRNVCLRACRTPDKRRVVAAWALYEDMSNALPRKGWEPPASPFPHPFEIVPIECKGRGMLATREIKKGEIIVCERPIIIVPKYSSSEDGRQPWTEAEKYMLQLVYWLEQDDREKFVQLHNCKPPRSCAPLMGIVRTNSFGVSTHTLKSSTDYCAVCLNISYVNHSCDPNASYNFDQETMTMELLADRDIESGEEITICYIDKFSPKTDRQNELKTKYCFTCNCARCLAESESDPVEDNRRRFIIKAIDDLEDSWEKLLESPPWSRQETLKRNIEAAELILQAMKGVDMPEKRVRVSQHLGFVYALIGDLENFNIWSEECLKDLESQDNPGGVYGNWKKWHRNPATHPCWAAW